VTAANCRNKAESRFAALATPADMELGARNAIQKGNGATRAGPTMSLPNANRKGYELHNS
jgi:hypothetical protein